MSFAGAPGGGVQLAVTGRVSRTARGEHKSPEGIAGTLGVMRRAWLYVATMLVVGFLGAYAFNPDDGVVLHSEPLWTIFGLAVYAAVIAALALIVFWAGRAVLRRLQKGRHIG